MALEMQFTDQYGYVNARSYWRIVQVNISVPDKSALVVFYGYKDAQARTDGKSPIAAKQYAIMGETFDTCYQEHLEPGGPNIATMAYDYAKALPDTPDGKGGSVSFFSTATDA